MVKVRFKNNPKVTGITNRFNGTGEVIMGFDGEGGMSSEFISDLEVMINGRWILLSDAFDNHDLITDNYNTEFFEPRNDEDRKRGYVLTVRDLAELEATIPDNAYSLSGD